MTERESLRRAGTLPAQAAALATVLASVLALSGCVSFIPPYERPAAPVAQIGRAHV